MSSEAARPNPPARDEDIVRVEEMVGARLPAWLRDRLTTENGFQVDDSCGATGRKWRILPVMDRSNRKRMTKTVEDIARRTSEWRQFDFFPDDAVLVGWAEGSLAEQDWLVLLPDADDPSVLGTSLHRQSRSSEVEPLGVTFTEPAPTVLEEALEPLPVFRYHPDPVGTGSVRRSPNACPVCRRKRGFEYTAVPYGPKTLRHVCPWCIADGSAAATEGASFCDQYPLVEAGITEAVIEEVAFRTPGFASTQQEEWQVCHDDACAFVGPLSVDEAWQLPQETKDEYHLSDDMLELSAESELGVFGFRCLHCGALKIWLDFS